MKIVKKRLKDSGPLLLRAQATKEDIVVLVINHMMNLKKMLNKRQEKR